MREVALITGTRKGIGRFLVDHFVQRGSRGASQTELTGEFQGDVPMHQRPQRLRHIQPRFLPREQCHSLH